MKSKNLPEGWQEVALGDIFIFQNKSGKKAGEGMEYGTYKFFTSSSEQTKFIDEFDYNGEHLIFATGGQAGIHYCNEKFSASNDCFVVKVDAKILAKYVFYYLSFKIYLLEEGFRGAGLKHISKNYLNKIKIVYSEKKETQKKIVSILEKAERLKQKRQEADKLTQEYLKAVFYEMFGDPIKNEKKWSVVTILDISEKTQIGPFGTQLHVEDYIDNGIPLINPTHIINNKIYPEVSFTVSKKKFAELTNYHLKMGDIVMGRRGEMARCAVVTSKENGWLCGTGSLFIRPKKNIDTTFLLFFLIHESTKQTLENESRGVTMNNLNLTIVNNLKIILPPLPHQQKFARIVEKVENLKEKQKQSKEKIDELFDSLMQKAFNGESVR